MDYDLWVRLAALAPVQYLPRLWANFRLHTQGKNDHRGCPLLGGNAESALS